MKPKDDTPLINRREFIQYQSAFLFFAATGGGSFAFQAAASSAPKKALEFPHFPNTLYAFLWRNWDLVPLHRLGEVAGASVEQLLEVGSRMGLPTPPHVSEEQLKRSYLTIIRRNWHILPEDQLLTLLNWTKEKFDFTLQEDDFFFIKMGRFKPECAPVSFTRQAKLSPSHKEQFKLLLRRAFPHGLPQQRMPYFGFIDELSTKPTTPDSVKDNPQRSSFSPRIAYPYFALFGDPLLQDSQISYPDGYLDRLVASGVDAIWLHLVLHKVTPFPWNPAVSDQWELRLKNLRALSERTSSRGIRIYLYLNEPRHQPASFFQQYPHLRGYRNGLCTSLPEIQNYLADSIALIVKTAPNLGGFISITASENPTNCWSHNQGKECVRCAKKGAGTVIAELNNTYKRGIDQGIASARSESGYRGDGPQLIIWDWGWRKDWAETIIPKLVNNGTAIMSVSEWDLPIERGNVKSSVGEYSISAIGPGPRARMHWALAKQYGHRIVAKIQANNSWELGAVPYIPAIYNVATHIENLKKENIDGLMLSWSLGGYPSPTLEVVKLMTEEMGLSMEDAISQVAQARFGVAADAVKRAWKKFSTSFQEFPFNIRLIYYSPLHSGPSNLLFQNPTGFTATMTGFPYDDLKTWRAIYPAATYIALFRKMAAEMFSCQDTLCRETEQLQLALEQKKALESEMRVFKACSIHYATLANQAEFIVLRDQRKTIPEEADRQWYTDQIRTLLKNEIELAQQLADLQLVDPRIGYEASNHYFYTPNDLYEKILNCQYLLDNVFR